MKDKKVAALLLGVLVVGGTAVAAPITFSDNLKGYSGTSEDGGGTNQPAFLVSSPWEASFIYANNDNSWERINYTASGTMFGLYKDGFGGRNYMRTQEKGYGTVGFTAYVTLNRLADAPGTTANPLIAFGLGAGEQGKNRFLDQEITGAYTSYMQMQENFDNVSMRMIADGAESQAFWNPMTTPAGLMRLQMVYDDAAETLTFAIDYDYTGGAFAVDQQFNSIDVSTQAAQWDLGADSAIIFGGDGQSEFTDFEVTVIPEPVTLGLVAATGLGILFVRRRLEM